MGEAHIKIRSFNFQPIHKFNLVKRKIQKSWHPHAKFYIFGWPEWLLGSVFQHSFCSIGIWSRLKVKPGCWSVHNPIDLLLVDAKTYMFPYRFVWSSFVLQSTAQLDCFLGKLLLTCRAWSAISPPAVLQNLYIFTAKLAIAQNV